MLGVVGTALVYLCFVFAPAVTFLFRLLLFPSVSLSSPVINCVTLCFVSLSIQFLVSLCELMRPEMQQLLQACTSKAHLSSLLPQLAFKLGRVGDLVDELERIK